MSRLETAMLSIRRALLPLSTAALVGLSACAHAPAPDAASAHHHREHVSPTMPHRFENAEEWAKRFEEPGRDAWQKPDEVVRALGLAADAKVADIGSGTGYFAVRLARAVPQGRVYGVDVEPDMTRYLGERARKEGLGNLEAVQATPDDPKLPAPVDLALIVDTYHHVGERVAWLQKLGGSLTPGGRVAIVDFRPDSPKGPPAKHKLSSAQVTEELRAAGYVPTQSFDFLPDQYFLVFQRQTP
ncbi:class I SAM-dependent methyltransferase [Archangium primigenium]|uniref:class I SAM-dependent methyltransferase n=1 Tax=[Archangium] primigenium TaxID=2792470 RepID=UPI001EF96346|nr:class I SAM-dependent methyltransferase [Archangium primigenium]